MTPSGQNEKMFAHVSTSVVQFTGTVDDCAVFVPKSPFLFLSCSLPRSFARSPLPPTPHDRNNCGRWRRWWWKQQENSPSGRHLFPTGSLYECVRRGRGRREGESHAHDSTWNARGQKRRKAAQPTPSVLSFFILRVPLCRSRPPSPFRGAIVVYAVTYRNRAPTETNRLETHSLKIIIEYPHWIST